MATLQTSSAARSDLPACRRACNGCHIRADHRANRSATPTFRRVSTPLTERVHTGDDSTDELRESIGQRARLLRASNPTRHWHNTTTARRRIVRSIGVVVASANTCYATAWPEQVEAHQQWAANQWQNQAQMFMQYQPLLMPQPQVFYQPPMNMGLYEYHEEVRQRQIQYHPSYAYHSY